MDICRTVQHQCITARDYFTSSVQVLQKSFDDMEGFDALTSLAKSTFILIGQGSHVCAKALGKAWVIQHITRLPTDLMYFIENPIKKDGIDSARDWAAGRYLPYFSTCLTVASRAAYIVAWLAKVGVYDLGRIAVATGLGTVLTTTAIMNFSTIAVTVGVIGIYGNSLAQTGERLKQQGIPSSGCPVTFMNDIVAYAPRELSRIPSEILQIVLLVQYSAQILCPGSMFVLSAVATEVLAAVTSTVGIIDLWNNASKRIGRKTSIAKPPVTVTETHRNGYEWNQRKKIWVAPAPVGGV